MNIFTDESKWLAEWQHRQSIEKIRCNRCLYDATTPSIKFDDKGVCNYCHTHDELMLQYPGGTNGDSQFAKIVDQIKYAGRHKQYDVIVGVSGGADSSYLLYLAKQHGLRPLAVHFDNTWNSTIAVENIHNVLQKLDIELFTHVVDNEEYDALYRAILLSGVPDLEAPTDLALAATLNIAAAKYGIKYIFEGHSFKTEGMSPLGWLYMDAKYIHSIYKQYGTGKKLKSYPYMWLSTQIKWMLLNRLKKIRPLWYLDYNKQECKQMLTQDFAWQWYGGHHLENRMTNFYHTYFMPRRFGIDQRVNGFSALIRSGQMSREQGLEELSEPPTCDLELVGMVQKRLQFTTEQFVECMQLPKRYYTEFNTYKPTFERLRPFFYLMTKLEFIPMSFYLKYTAKKEC